MKMGCQRVAMRGVGKCPFFLVSERAGDFERLHEFSGDMETIGKAAAVAAEKERAAILKSVAQEIEHAEKFRQNGFEKAMTLRGMFEASLLFGAAGMFI